MIGALAVPTSEALMLELDWPAPYLPARIQTVSPGLILPPAPESAVARSHGLAIVPLPLALPEVVTYQLLPLETGGGLPALGAAATETLTLTVLEPAEPAFTVTAPVETATASVPALEPDAGETLSQLWLLDAVQLIVPEPLLDTETLCAAGFPPPAVAEKLRVLTLIASAGVPLGGVPPVDVPPDGVLTELPEAGETWMALTSARRVTPVKLRFSVPLVTVAVNCSGSGVSGATCARMSKLLSTVAPLIATLNTRWPCPVYWISANRSFTL